MKKKRKKRSGFTLMETLATVLIMSLVVSASVTGMAALTSTYNKVLSQSNAEQLCTSINTVMTGELSYAKYIKVDSDKNLTEFYSASYRTCYYELLDGKLVINSASSGQIAVLNNGLYTEGMKITDMSIKYDATEKLFTVDVHIGDGVNEITSNTFYIKNINS